MFGGQLQFEFNGSRGSGEFLGYLADVYGLVGVDVPFPNCGVGLLVIGEVGGYAGQAEGLGAVVNCGDVGGQCLAAGVGGLEWVGHDQGGLAGGGYGEVGRFGLVLVVEDAAVGGGLGGGELVKGESTYWPVFSAAQCFYLGFE